MNALEVVVEFVRDNIVLPNVGKKWVNTWTPLILTFFIFILCANAIGLIPIFDVLALARSLRPAHRADDSFVKQLMHGGTTATGELQRHRRAGDDHLRRHHRRRLEGARLREALEEPRAARADLVDLHPADSDRDHGHVRPAVRADDATCGQHDRRPHRDSRDSVVRVPVHRDVRTARLPVSASALAVSVPLAVGISVLEIIVVLVQAYVFTLLTAVFIGMAIHVHH